jgi:hypothetical protein
MANRSAHIQPVNDFELVLIVQRFVRGREIKDIQRDLDAQCSTYPIECKMRYQELRPNMERYKFYIASILDDLDIRNPLIISEYQNSPDFYAFLTKLKTNHHQIATLVDMIDNTKPKYDWRLHAWYAALLTSALSVLFYFKSDYLDAIGRWLDRAIPIAIDWLGKTSHLIQHSPLIGLPYRAISILWIWHHTFANGPTAEPDKLTHLVLKTAEHVLPASALILCYLAAGIVTPAAMALFISGAAVDLVRSFYILGRAYQSPSAHTPADELRLTNLKDRAHKTLITSAIASALIIFSVAIWCMFPASLVITLSSIIFAWFVGMAKDGYLMQIDHDSARDLQVAIKNSGYYENEDKGPEIQFIDTARLLETSTEQCINLTRERDQLLDEKNSDRQKIIQLTQEVREQRIEFDAWKGGIQEGVSLAQQTHRLFYTRQTTPNANDNPYDTNQTVKHDKHNQIG